MNFKEFVERFCDLGTTKFEQKRYYHFFRLGQIWEGYYEEEEE